MKAFVYTLLSFFISLSFTHVYSQELGKTMKVPYVDGVILDMVQQGDTMFIAGSFSHVLHADSGETVLMLADSACTNLKNLGLNGSFHELGIAIYDMLPDGKGGWFISGYFDHIGDSTRMGLAHLDSSGKLTGKFSNSQFNGLVSKMKLHGDTLLVSGSFDSYGKSFNNYGLASLHPDSIEFMGQKADNRIIDAVPDDEGGYFVTGYFQKYGDSLRHNFTHIDSNGNVTGRLKGIHITSSPIGKAGDLIAVECRSFSRTAEKTPVFHTDLTPSTLDCPAPDYFIDDHVMNQDKSYFVGGSFRRIGNQNKTGLALIDSNHNLTSWESPIKDLYYVEHLTGNDTFLYVDATCMNKLTNHSTRKLYKIKLSSREVVWEYTVGKRYVQDLTMRNGKFYVLFSNQDIFSPPFNNYLYTVEVFDIRSNRRLEEHFLTNNAGSMYQPVFNGDYLYMAGTFSSIMGINRSNFAQISLHDFQVTPLNIGATLGTYFHFTAGDSQIYFLTTGNGIYGPNTGRGKCYDFKNSAWTAWDFEYKKTTTHSSSTQFILGESGVLIANSYMDSISGIRCEPMVLLDRDSGNIRAMLPAYDIKSNVLFAKNFINLFDSKDNYFQSDYKTVKFFNSKTGALKDSGIIIGGTWNQNVERITGFGDKFVVEGTFNRANDLTVPGRFIVDTLGNIIPFDFSMFIGQIKTVAIYDTIILVGGTIYVPGLPSSGLFAFGLASQQPIPNFPVFNGNVQQIDLKGNELFVLGTFSQVDTTQRKYLASINLSNYSITNFNPRFEVLSPFPESMEVGDGIVHLFGDFKDVKYNGSRYYRQGYIGINIANDSIYKPILLGQTYSNVVPKGVSSKNRLLFIDIQPYFGDKPCPHVAAINLKTEELIDWMPDPDNYVTDIAVMGNKVILAGGFFNVNGNYSPYMAFYDGLVNSPMANTSRPNDVVMELVPSSTGLFAVGNFTSVQSKPRNKIAMFDPSNGVLTNWEAPGLSNTGKSYAFRDSSIYFLQGSNLVRYDTGRKIQKIVAQGAFSFQLIDSGFIASGSFGKGKVISLLNVYHQGNSPVVMGNYDTIGSTHFGPRGSIFTGIVKSGSQYLIKGIPTSSGVFSGNVGAFRISTGEPIHLGIQADDTVFRLKVRDNKLLVYGKFDRINDSVRNYIALYNLKTKQITPWKLNGNTYSIYTEYSMALYDNEVILGNGVKIIDSLGVTHEGFMIVDDSVGSNFKPLPIGNYWAGLFHQKDSVLFFYGSDKASYTIGDEGQLLAYNLKTDSFLSISQKPIHFKARLGWQMYVNDSFVFIGAKGPGSSYDTLLKVVNWRTNEIKPNRMKFSGTQNETRITSLNAYQGKLYISYVSRMYNTSGTIYPQTNPGNFSRAIDEYTLEDDGRNETFNMRLNEIYPTSEGIAYGGEFYLGSHSNKKYLQSIAENPRLNFAIKHNVWCGSPDTIYSTFGLGLTSADSIDYTLELFKENAGSHQLIHTSNYFLPYQNEKVKMTYGSLVEGNYFLKLSLTGHPEIHAIYRDFTILPKPLARINSLSSQQQCQDGNQFILNDSSTSTLPFQRLWTSSDSLTDTATQVLYQRSQAGTTTWQLVVIDSSGCSDTTMIQVQTFPEPVFALKALTTQDLCAGDSTLFETDTVTTSWVYTLIKDGNTIDSNNSGQFWISDSSSYRIAALTPQGCSSTSAPVQINIHPIPSAPIIIGTDSIIGLDTSIFTTPSDTALSYFWTSQGISLNTTSDSLVAVWIYEGYDTLSLYVESRWGCKSEKSFHTIFIDMIPDSLVLSHDTLFADPYGDTLKMYVVSNLVWNVIATPGWTSFDKTTGTGIDSVLIIFAPNAGTGSRDYQVVFEADTLSDTLVLIQGTYLNLTNFVFREINMYPNPAFSELQFINQGFEPVMIRIRNASGVLIRDGVLGENDALVMQVEDWKSGLYLVEIENSTGREYRKLLVVH